MSINRDRPHLLVLPEDQANREIVIGLFEEIGWKLAHDCPRHPAGIWNHELLKHNGVELDRMWKTFGAILFPSKVIEDPGG